LPAATQLFNGDPALGVDPAYNGQFGLKVILDRECTNLKKHRVLKLDRLFECPPKRKTACSQSDR
jgi:hypothetical protein